MSFDDDDFELHLSSDFEHSDDSSDELYDQSDISDALYQLKDGS